MRRADAGLRWVALLSVCVASAALSQTVSQLPHTLRHDPSASQPAGTGRISGGIAKPATTRPTDDFTRRLLEGRSSDVLVHEKLLAAMAEAQRRLLDEADNGVETHDALRRSLAAIDELIELAKSNESPSQQQQAGAARQGRTSARPQSRPADGREAGRAGKAQPARTAANEGPGAKDRRGLHDAADLQRRWGALPQRDREEILQGLDEEFPMRYRDYIEDYYRSIAEEPPAP